MARGELELNRRIALQGLAVTFASLAHAAFAEELAATPRVTEGPFYPSRLPLDTDNDLLVINDSITPAVGQITHLSGRILSSAGEPVRNAFVEIWQVDGRGVYLHPGSANGEKRDANFQGYGRFLTDAQGRYYFRTVKPVAYPQRPAPHIHFGVSRNGRRICTTQLFVAGDSGNEKDFIYQDIRGEAARKAVSTSFDPIKDSKLQELAANFDIVLGMTPQDADDAIHGGIGKPESAGRRNR